jgi:hypothetical protein
MADIADSGGRDAVGAAEDDHPAQRRPKTATAEPDDAVDDAYYVCLPDHVLPQRTGSLLVDIQYHQHCHAVFRHRVGWLHST